MSCRYEPYTTIKSAAIALFTTADFSQSLVRLLNIRDADSASLVAVDLSRSRKRTLSALLGMHMIFSGVGLIATLALLGLGGVARRYATRDTATPKRHPAERSLVERLDLAEKNSIGWVCKLLNFISMICAFAVAIMMITTASYPGGPLV